MESTVLLVMDVQEAILARFGDLDRDEDVHEVLPARCSRARPRCSRLRNGRRP
ncbi:MAG: hypothetical protein ACR2FU_19315 [Streptosporangiaceae bacterium]